MVMILEIQLFLLCTINNYYCHCHHIIHHKLRKRLSMAQAFIMVSEWPMQCIAHINCFITFFLLLTNMFIIIIIIIIVIIIILMAWMLDDSGTSVPPGRASSPLNTTTIKTNALKLFETSLQQIALLVTPRCNVVWYRALSGWISVQIHYTTQCVIHTV